MKRANSLARVAFGGALLVFLATSCSVPNERILRRGYSFTDGMDSRTGQLDASLFFISFQRDPGKQFVLLQRRLGQNDRLTEYIQHTGSAVFACPPGIKRGDYVGEQLFA